MSERTALVAGATGLVGGLVLRALLEDQRYDSVVAVGRRPVALDHPRLVQKTVDFRTLRAADLPAGLDAFCALGTTIKKAGSEQAFRAVDHDSVLSFADSAMGAGTRRFHLVSALGANARSMFFYNRVKGEVEDTLSQRGFRSLSIYRPSLLLGDRAESRPAERAGIALAGLVGPLLRWVPSRPIEAEVVAKAMVAVSKNPPEGTKIYENSELFVLAKER